MKKILLLLFCLFFYFKNHSQITVTNEIYDSNSCIEFVDLSINISNYDSTKIYLLSVISPLGVSWQEYLTQNTNTPILIQNISIPASSNIFVLIFSGGNIEHTNELKIDIIKCQNDLDSDGVLNIDDNCPKTYSTSNNHGCLGNPDLVIDERLSYQYSDCYSCRSTIYENNFANDQIPEIYRYGGNITIKPLVIKNIGNGNPQINESQVTFYLSEDRDLSSDDFKFSQRTKKFSPIPKMGESTDREYAVSLEGADIGTNKNPGIYYILIIIDEDNLLGNSEINTSNNISRIKVKYTKTLSKSSSINSITLLDLNGRVLTKATVKDKNEALVLFNNLNIKEGIYVLHTYNNGNLIKKIKLYKKMGPIDLKQLEF
jgi:hypothetical protein